MDNTQTITLDIMNDKTYDYIYTKQYDKGREIYFTIVDRGTPISLSGLNVGFELKKPDGNICVYTDTADPSVLAIEGNQVLLTLTDQMTVLSGKLPYQISLLDGEKIISTVTGFVWCEKSAVQYDDVESVSGGSLIEDIQHIDEKINGIMLCGENPPTDDIGDENSRYVQIADGEVVKEFTKYDGHWVDFPEGGGGSGNVDDVYVNGVSVLDSQHIAQIKSYKEVTQAQYDALPSSKLTDGIMYCITDSNAFTDVVGTLTAGNTTVTLSSSAITTDSTFEFYTDAYGLSPIDVSVSTGSITLTFEEQEANVGVKVRVS